MIYLGLGTNLGDREANLQSAISSLASSGIELVRASSIYETAPREVENQPWFLNMVVECSSSLFPLQLMQRLLRLEKQLGRDRTRNAVHRGPRLIDIDVLLFNNAVIQTPRLTVPHPRILDRRFVLEPLLEVAPSLRDPRTGLPLNRALAAVLDQKVSKRPAQAP